MWGAGPEEGRATWPRSGRRSLKQACKPVFRPVSAPATNGFIWPWPYGGTEVAHLSWERRPTPAAERLPPLTQEPGAPKRRVHGNSTTAYTGTGTVTWK